MNIFALSLFLVLVLAEDYDVPRGRGNQRGCVFPPTSVPPNLIIRMQGKGRVMRFMCSSGSLLFGKRFSTCLRGRWSNPPPICISKGCAPQSAPPNGRVAASHEGAMLTFGCNPGYIQNGSNTIYCALYQWNDTAPTCKVPTINPNVSCDFEDPDLCGWSHDVTHDFEWKRNKFSTPSGHVGTGPSFDHTLGKGLSGYYMYLEASAPQKEGDITRLFSPVYPTTLSNSCFSFWYHMYGSSIGSLRVYLKEENQVLAELKPVWRKDSETGNIWLQGHIDVPQLTTSFQLVIEGVRGDDYMGDIAFDDVSLSPGSCPIQTNESVTVQEGNLTGATTTDEGGGASEPASQKLAELTTVAYTGEVTTSTLLRTVSKEPSVATTTHFTSGTVSDVATSSSVTKEQVPNTPSISKVEFSTAVTAATTALPRPQHPNCVIDTSSATSISDQNWIVSISDCSTKSQISIPATSEVLSTTQGTTVGYKYTTIPSIAVTTTSSLPPTTTGYSNTQAHTYLTTTKLQSTTTVSPTTKTRFIFPITTKASLTTTTPLSTVPTTTQTTTTKENNPVATTKRAPFLPKNPTTTAPASKVTPTSSVLLPTTTTTATTTTRRFVPTKITPSFTTTAATTTTRRFVPTKITPSFTTTKSTSSAGTTTTTTRKPVTYIVPKTNGINTNTPLPLGSTTSTGQVGSTSTETARTEKRGITTTPTVPFVPTNRITTPESTTDLRRFFPTSRFPDSVEDTGEEEMDHSGQKDDSSVDVVTDTKPESEAQPFARRERFPERPHPRKKSTTGAGISAIATACSLAAVVLVVSVLAAFYLVRRRKLKHQRFSSNSEMRFITQSEELELGAPDNSDMIKLL